MNICYIASIKNKFFFTTDDSIVSLNNQAYSPGLIMNKVDLSSISVKFSQISFDILDDTFQKEYDIENSRLIISLLDKDRKKCINMYNGYISSIEKFDRYRSTINAYPIFQKLNYNIGNFFSQSCRNVFGDDNCGIQLDKYRVPGSIIQVINNFTFTGQHQEFISSYFQFGILEFTSGENKGMRFYIKDNSTSNQIIFFEKNQIRLSIGDTYNLYPGCDKTTSTCKKKFHNMKNFNGEPFIS